MRLLTTETSGWKIQFLRNSERNYTSAIYGLTQPSHFSVFGWRNRSWVEVKLILIDAKQVLELPNHSWAKKWFACQCLLGTTHHWYLIEEGRARTQSPTVEIMHPSFPHLGKSQRSTQPECNGQASLWGNHLLDHGWPLCQVSMLFQTVCLRLVREQQLNKLSFTARKVVGTHSEGWAHTLQCWNVIWNS